MSNHTLSCQIITPVGIIYENEKVDSATLNTESGEVTILAGHIPYFASLNEGILVIRFGKYEEAFAIGSGYVQTDGKTLKILASSGYGQKEIDENNIKEAIKSAEETIKSAPSEKERSEALAVLRRSTLGLKLIKRKKIH